MTNPVRPLDADEEAVVRERWNPTIPQQHTHGDADPTGRCFACDWSRLWSTLDAVRVELALQRGASTQDTNRLIAAADLAGIAYGGCDTPDDLAEELLTERHNHAEALRATAELGAKLVADLATERARNAILSADLTVTNTNLATERAARERAEQDARHWRLLAGVREASRDSLWKERDEVIDERNQARALLARIVAHWDGCTVEEEGDAGVALLREARALLDETTAPARPASPASPPRRETPE